MKIRFKIYLIAITTFLLGIGGFIFITRSLEDPYYIYRKKQLLKKQEDLIRDEKQEVIQSVSVNKFSPDGSLKVIKEETEGETLYLPSKEYRDLYSSEELEKIKEGNSLSRVLHRDGDTLLIRRIFLEDEYYILKTDLSPLGRNFNLSRELDIIAFIIIMTILSTIFIVYSRIVAKKIDEVKSNLTHVRHREFDKVKTMDSDDEIGEISKLISEVGEETRKNLIHFQGKAEEQKEFLRNFGHEIKTPLTIASGYTDILKKRSPENNHLKIISKELVRISRITRMFQEFSAGKKDLFIEKLPLADLLDIGRIFAENNTSTTYRESLQNLERSRISCDIELVESLFYNLYSNAFNYCKERVETLLYLKGNSILLTIANDTTSPPEEDISKLWRPFYRGSEVPKAKGTGLGLSIVRDIASKHNWRIYLKNSENLFQVTIEIPIEN
ncbi:two-component sensor histidine kinase [Propionigenium maris DSM 9537]|uniref:histidine kinase n=1 Tax=Propionigenium maris DSM 9537 TaxID=1123000 RepID=A0A9W6GL12_9FUSO|nr:HAMP domain-containing sensor histidine kinase [Propionigenium maris]GLI55527.1 two-component sensor histidine kinase [Propionigenium maris DSM 9537]